MGMGRLTSKSLADFSGVFHLIGSAKTKLIYYMTDSQNLKMSYGIGKSEMTIKSANSNEDHIPCFDFS